MEVGDKNADVIVITLEDGESEAVEMYVHVCVCKLIIYVYNLFSVPSAGVQELNGVNSSYASLSISWMPPP